MAKLGPFEPKPRIAAAVSGGADSMALAVLAGDWARRRGGSLLALIVDHGLRPESANEARLTRGRLDALGIAARVLPIDGLSHGPGLASRARAARFAVLEAACLSPGILHLLLGHHAADQAETLMMRSLSGSGLAGYAGMAAVRETAWLRVIRPLLGVSPERLRATLRERRVAWVEDPTNSDRQWLRARLRPAALRAAYSLSAAALSAGQAREAAELRRAAELSKQVSIWPEGYALLRPGPVSSSTLAAVIATISGSPFYPPLEATIRLAGDLRPATLHGVQILPARRLGTGWMIVREEASMATPVRAEHGIIWDRRFRVGTEAHLPAGCMVGGLGKDAAKLRRLSSLPSAVLRTLPCLRNGDLLFSVPHLGYSTVELCAPAPIAFAPPHPLACAPFPA
ncbi:MAG: tRNA lysidine(34) synthetase TilS [Acetobacteraceae bacterium]|nr:tRNA lysidine(34) synthetase TilS [Acetobacteraceae bacterium]